MILCIISFNSSILFMTCLKCRDHLSCKLRFEFDITKYMTGQRKLLHHPGPLIKFYTYFLKEEIIFIAYTLQRSSITWFKY